VPGPSGPRLPRPATAVIFDLDGVLLDTEPLYTLAANRVLEPFGGQFDWALKSQTMGKDARVGAQIVIDAFDLPLSVDSYLHQRAAVLHELFVTTPAIPGAESWVALLNEASVPLAVATSSTRELCDIKWARHPWIKCIDPITCGDDPAVKTLKPAPDIYLEAARRLGIAAEQCLVFEDSPAGVQAALAAGMLVVALKAPELPAELVSDAHCVVSSYDELTLPSLGLQPAGGQQPLTVIGS
jgi:pseudouridine-5'-monophosphatase